MKRLLPRAALQGLQWIGQTLDPFFAGRWYWSLRRWAAERQLQHALDQHSDQSMQARRATERYRRADFAVRYWRSAPGPVMQVADQALDAGVPMHAVRLVVLSTDLRIRDGQVHLRRPFIVTVLNTIFATIVGVHMFLMCLIAVTAPSPAWLKIVVILAIAFVYCFLYYGWSLYTSRPQQIVAKHGQTFDALCAASTTRSHKKVRNLASH
ncbi:hypothetical protein [Stenotrophomonas maltophilia]|uniref:hypothetical protein n=1 Tax=Stenotrophomonas maltophilia TaxID=40324 RepID=UPI0021C0072E|nr:hypothetical protein [Stenotrophomonas maltophilia]UXL29802.1 hypothetical protein N0O74_03030 [Stenotrophomonas maltophilia]